MATIINTPFRTAQVTRLIDEYNTASSNYLYMLFGETTPWANEALPDAPVDSVNYITNTVWANTLAITRVNPLDFAGVVTRYDYADGLADFVVFDPASATAYDSKFYCMNSAFQVFKLSGKGVSPPVTSIEPVYTTGNPVVGSTTTGDKHEWTYLYTVATPDVTKFVTTSWIPVNYGDKLGTAQEQTDGDVDAINTLGCKDIALYHLMKDTDFVLGSFGEYRRVALVDNPLDDANTGKLAVSNVLLSATPGTEATGNVIYTENRTVVYRNTGQSEEVRVILAY